MRLIPHSGGGVGEGEEGRSCQTRGEDLVSVPSNICKGYVCKDMYFVYCTFDIIY